MARGGARSQRTQRRFLGARCLVPGTDSGPPAPRPLPLDLAYGENLEMQTQMKAAPMAGGATTLPPELAALVGGGTPIGAPTQFPDEPVTAGAPLGAGAGPEVMASSAQADAPTRAKLLAGLKPMMRLAEQPDASPEFRAIVRYLRGQA